MGSKVSIYSKMALSAKNAYAPLSFGSQLLPARYAQTPLTSTKNRHPLTSPKAPPNRLLVWVNIVFLPCFFLSIAESSQQIKAIIMNDNKNNAIFTSKQAAGSTNCCITKSAAVLALPFFSAAKSKSPCNAWGHKYHQRDQYIIQNTQDLVSSFSITDWRCTNTLEDIMVMDRTASVQSAVCTTLPSDSL